MKYAKFILASAVIMAVLCCTKETDEPEGLMYRQFAAGVENASSKTELSGSKVLWQSGDEISVFDGEGNRKFKTATSGVTAMFTGNVTKADNYTVLYPYSADAHIDKDTIFTEVPVRQQAVAGGFSRGANIAIGKLSADDVRVGLKNVCGLLCVRIPQYPTAIRTVRIESLGTNSLSGPVKIVGVNALSGHGAESYVQIEGDEYVAQGEYYACVIPGECSTGIKITVVLSNGDYLYKENTTPCVITRNVIVDFGTLDFSEFTLVEETPVDPTPDPVSEFASYGVDFSRLTGHPRLFMTDADFAGLRKRVNEEGKAGDYMYDFHQAMLYRTGQVSRKALDHDLEYFIDENGNLLDVCDEAMMRLIGLSYGYRITGESLYLEQARHDLACVCDKNLFPDWYHSDMMCPSEMSAAVSVAYDWLYNYLTKEERTAIEDALYRNELVPYSAYKPREDSNWNQSTTGAAIMTSIVLYDRYKTMCAATIDKSIASNKRAVKNIFYPYGSGKEGSGYCNYTISFEGCILQALETCFNTSCGIDEIQGLEENGEWFLFNDGPTGTFNYSDAVDESLSARTGQVFLATHYNRPDFFLREQEVLRQSRGGNRYDTGMHAHMPIIWLWKNQFTRTGVYPSKKVWTCQGDAPLVLARLGWTYGETDSYVGLKTAGGHSSHSHLDGGSFVFDALGYRWSADTRMGAYAGYKNDIYKIDGSSLFTYAKQKSLRWDIICQNNYFHSTLAFTWSANPEAKLHVTDQITDKACSVVEVYNPSADGRYGGKTDISDHYSDAASAVYRSVLLSDGALEVIDEITSRNDHSAPFEWRMLTKAQVNVKDGYVELSQGTKKMYLHCIASGDVSVTPIYGAEQTIERPSTWTPRGWDGYQSYEGYRIVKFSAEVAGGIKTGKFRTIISPVKP